MHVYTGINYRIREAKKDGDKVVDVDGSYLIKKCQRLQDSGVSTAPLDLPSVPLSGWEVVSEENYRDAAEKIPRLMPGTSINFYVKSLIMATPSFLLYRNCIHLPCKRSWS